MRFTLDTAREQLFCLPSDSEPLSRLVRTLGDASLQFHVFGNPIVPSLDADANLVAPGELQLTLKVLPSGPPIVSGAITIETTPATGALQILSLGEDWKSAALIALFQTPDQPRVALQGQLRWRNGDEEWSKTPLFDVVVKNSLFVEDILPGASAISAPYLYLSLVDAYIGGATSLESLRGDVLPADTILRVVIGGSESDWLVKKPAAEATDVDAGVIRLLDNTAHLERVAGL